MKLKVNKGELTLPDNFSFEIEHNNPFFSDDGTSSVTTTIPATPQDLANLEQPLRAARSSRFSNLFPAVIFSGIFHKNGTLVINSASEDGISCAIALEESDFYANYKEKNLKDLFSELVLTDYTTPAEWYDWLFQIYKGEVDSDFRIIPVAVDYNEDDGSYHVNNEPDTSSTDEIFPLLHSARLTTEGDETVHVPDGYGISPFLKLYIFWERMFELCGYTVKNNCFKTNDKLANLILLNNCSDTLCNGKINYSDLVPSKKISEILEWMQKKFHAQAIIHPSDKTVDIVLLEDVLAGKCDLDLSARLVGKLTMTYSKSKRVVLKSDTSLDEAAPAASTIQELIAKYHYCKEGYMKDSADVGLFFQKSTGRYYELHSSLRPSTRDYYVSRTYKAGSMKLIGTNYFNYDQDNSDSTEEISPADKVPPMLYVNGMLMPYIGQRKHRNTSYNGSEKDEDQDIIIVDYAGLSAKSTSSSSSERSTSTSSVSGTRGGIRRVATDTVGSHYYYGTTQKYDNIGVLREGKSGLTNAELMENFFKRYNEILLNNCIELSAEWDLKIPEIFQYDMCALKMYNGQKLLPVSMKYLIGDGKTRCENAKFYLYKDFADKISDTTIEFEAPKYKWQLNDSEVTAKKNEVQSANSDKAILARYNDGYSSGEKDFFAAAPLSLGEKTMPIERTVEFGYMKGLPRGQGSEFVIIETDTLYVWLESVSVS